METEKELHALAEKLEAHGVPVHRVEESTGKYAGQLMSLGIKPGPKSVHGKHLSNLPLLRFTDFPEYKKLRHDHDVQLKYMNTENIRLQQELEGLSWWERMKRWWHRKERETAQNG